MGRTIAETIHTIYNAREGDKFNADTTLEVVDCPTCGITYAIPESLKSSALRWHGDRPNGWKLCCPLGHEWWYSGKTAIEKAREEAQHQRDRAGRLASELDQTKASLRGTKGALTRARNEKARLIARVANGVCPCCNRTFKQLARHMASQHPDFVDQQAAHDDEGHAAA